MKVFSKLFVLTGIFLTTTACASNSTSPYKRGYEDGYEAGYKKAMVQKNIFPKSVILKQGETLYSKIGPEEAQNLIKDLKLDPSKLPVNFCATKEHKNAKWKICNLDSLIEKLRH